MAYIVKNVDVLDLKPSTGVGISVPFDGATGINTTYTTSDTIKSNLINFLLTGKRERVMNPNFGSGLREVLFEQFSCLCLRFFDAWILRNCLRYEPVIS